MTCRKLKILGLVFALSYALSALADFPQPIVEALKYLSQTTAAPSLTFIQDHDVKIIFKNMKELGPLYATNDALTVITEDDHQIIFVNSRHEKAPPQALAAVISHEILHSDRQNSLMEEMVAWTREAQTWEELQSKYPELKNIPIGKYPLVDRENAIVSLIQRHQLKIEIENNPTYQGLPLHSPGF